ncbi:sensor histidine kinase [Ohtaekwangia koreensis]|uniref:Histidine kinase n=1 Tax=Ohtaekwangia koreensis TaxID=688867 RepID=A0A1T5J9Y9_9BACT|nr:histidine kinase [Ohtaekwangia koreensis]SKC48241.1 Histidine kinase [Ohtaekwangia koreensis]
MPFHDEPWEKRNPIEVSVSPALLLQSRITAHAIFWLCLIVYEGLIAGMVDDLYLQRVTTSFIELPVKMAATYFTLYILIDMLLVHKKYSLFLSLLFLSMIFFGILARIVAYYTIYPMYYPMATNVPLFFLPKILITIFSIYSLVAIVASFHLIKHWYNHQQASQRLHQTAQQLEKEKLAAELKLLKSQINPHFLFNTLNNLYALTLQHSHKAPEMVYKLSQLMNYMLYDSNQMEVSLQKEIQYIQNYIDLEKVRYDTRLDVSLNVYDVPDTIHIAPLLILPFVENSFKHGVSNQLSGGWIRIDILIQENTLVLKVENSKNIFPPEDKPVSGIGLKNVRKRLDLIYADCHSLQLLDEDETYLVILKITIPGICMRKRPYITDQYIPA